MKILVDTNVLLDYFSDFEDCLQMECARAFKADYIITRNLEDYKFSEVSCLTPNDFCEMFDRR